MRGYPFAIFCTAAALLISPSALTKDKRIYLGVGTIKADRTSPAYSALEDAFLLKDLTTGSQELKTETSDAKLKKWKLKGLKVSSTGKHRKVAMLGEKIEVSHFTNRFITKTHPAKTGALAFARISKTDIDSLSSSQVKRVKEERFSSANALSHIQTNEGSDESRSSQKQEIERVELPSGVVLTKPVYKPTQKVKNSGVGRQTGVVITPRPSIAYKPVSETLFGKIEIDGGDVAFDRGDYVYYIERTLDGRVYESGTVSAEDEKFSIEVADRLGVLGVELRSLDGEVLAYGETMLAPLDSGKDSSVTLFPSEDLFSGRVLKEELSSGGVEVASGDAVHNVSGVEGLLEADKKGYFNESLFEKGSSFVVETKAKERWSQVSLSVSGKPLYSRLFKKSIFSLLSKTADPFGEEIEVQTVLMGEVTQLGLAQREVEVRIFDQEHQKPLYFGAEARVDHKLVKTSTDGKFAFINLPNGGYLVQAFRGETLLAQKWFIVKEGSVSKGQIEINSKTSVVASTEVFPPRTRLSKEVTFEEVGAGVSFDLNQTNEAKVDLKSNPEIAVFESLPSESFSRHSYVTSSKLLKKRFKVVYKPWLESFLNARRSNANRALGVVVGFIRDDRFEVVKSTTTSLSSTSVVYYFDKNGDSVDEGLPGGGFVITDVKPGVQTTVVKLKSKEVFANKILLSRPYSISIF